MKIKKQVWIKALIVIALALISLNFVYAAATGTPSTTLAFFMSSESTFSTDKGPQDNNNFDECPIQLNDYGDTSEKCELWDCTAWSQLEEKQGYSCTGGWNCTVWNGVSCETYNCEAWTLSGTDKRFNLCRSGWDCKTWNGDYCEYWNCDSWSITSDDNLDPYCSGEWDCISWNNDVCDNWNCTNWTESSVAKEDAYCSGLWDCISWNGDSCDQWNCTGWTDDIGDDKFDVHCTGSWNCSSWNGDYCDNWECTSMTLTGQNEVDFYCDRWNCSLWDETKEACETWDCLEWVEATEEKRDYYCSGVYNCTTWKTFSVADTTPPATVTGLTNQSQDTTWIYWTWTNPGDADFSENIVYLDGAWKINTSNNFYNATSLTSNTSYTITVHTKDNSSNVNDTDVNSTTITLSIACTENLTNTSWTSWINITCLPSDTMNESRNLTQYDINNCGAANQTLFEYQNISACDYCTPSLTNTSWTSWYNTSECYANSTIDQERNLTEYDSNYCGEVSNTTYFEYQSVGCTYDPGNATINETVEDAQGNPINTTLEIIDESDNSTVYNQTGNIHSLDIPKNIEYTIRISPVNHKIKEIIFTDINITEDLNQIIDIDDPADNQDYNYLYAINPLINLSGNSTFNVTINASAYSNTLYKCVDWNFTSRNCTGNWTLLQSITGGQEYTITLNSTDPGFGEGGADNLEIYRIQPMVVENDHNMKVGVAVYNPTNSNITISGVIDQWNIDKIIDAGKLIACSPSCTADGATETLTWDGNHTINAGNYSIFTYTMDLNNPGNPVYANVTFSNNDTSYSVNNVYIQDAVAAAYLTISLDNLTFNETRGLNGTVNQTFYAKIEETADDEEITTSQNVIIELPSNWTSVGSNYPNVTIDGNKVIYAPTAAIINSNEIFSFYATAPNLNEGWLFNGTLNGTDAGSVVHNDLFELLVVTTQIDAVPDITLNSPANNSNFTVSQITFNCSATDDNQLQNITLYLGKKNTTTTEQTGFTTFIANYSTWKYEDSDAWPGSGWYNTGFNDSSWSSGAAYLATSSETCGVGLNTTLAGGSPAYLTYYFRKNFTIDDVNEIVNMSFNVDYDDAWIVYINGNIIDSNDLSCNWENHAATCSVPGTYHDSIIDCSTGYENPVFPKTTLTPTHISYLVNGTNYIAVAIKQSVVGSSDAAFMLNLYGYVNITVQNITYDFQPNQTTDISGTSNTTTWTVDLSGDYIWNCYACDNASSCKFADQNNSLTAQDITPPASVASLANQSQDKIWIYWTWTNPGDADFDSSIIYIDGTNVANTSNNYYNATSFSCGETHNITIHTKDTIGNINNTNINDTATTGACNNLPIASIPTITPSTAYTNNNLNCSFTITDADAGDTLTANYTWYNNSIATITGTMNITNGTQESILLENGNTSKTETWNCSIIPYDNSEYGTEKSTTKTIQNTPPTSPIIDILPAVPNDDDDLAANIANASTDIDNDTITYSYQWYKNNILQAGQTASTLSNLLTTPGEIWKVEATPNDGTADGTVGNNSVTINGTIPTYAVNLISPSAGSTWTSSSTVTFQYNTTLNATNCSLIIDSSIDQSDTNITPNATQTFTKTLSNAAYTWSVNCTDINNITNSSASWSLSVSYSPASPPSGGGGGGGSRSYDCDDNQDNDGDGLIDLSDPGCDSRYDNDESNAEESEEQECSELWSCSNWGKCTDNMQQRLCLDANECGTEEFKLPETRECGEQTEETAEETSHESIQADTTKEEIQQIKENQLKEYNFEGKLLQKFSFVYKGKTHYITVKEIREKSALIEITSDPIEETLELQRPSTVDIDNDGSPDIRIILKSIKGDKVEITIRILGSGISSVTGEAIKVLPYKRPNPYYSIPTILLLIIFIVLISVRKTHISAKKKKYITILHFVLMGLILLLFVSSVMKNFPVIGAFLTNSASTTDTPNNTAFPMTILAFIIAVSSVVLMIIERRRIKRFIEHESHKTRHIPKNQSKNKIIHKLKKAYKL